MVWLDDSILVHVPAGGFTMGGDGPDNPSHAVDLSAFWITRTKVKNAQFALCVAAGNCSPPEDEAAAAAMTSPELREHPIVGVDWLQADVYCRWMGGHLPTEAQWEKAARGPESSTYPWGQDSPTCDLLNAEDCVGQSSRVSAYGAGLSYYGAFDMAGNAMEWVQDWYGADYYESSPALDPPGPSAPQPGAGRVIRGSSYATEFEALESARRGYLDPAESRSDLGFRCVVESPILRAPFCQTTPYESSAITTAHEPCLLPSIEAGGSYCNQGFPYANLTISGPANSVTSAALRCTDQGNGLWTCTGPNKTSGEVVACSCPGLPPNPDVGPQVCPSTQVLGPAGSCIPLADLDADSGSPCPAGFSPHATPGATVCSADSVPPFLEAPTICPVGSYLDSTAESCIGFGPTSPTCLPGFTFDVAQQCCASPIVRTSLEMSTYPGCPPFEYFDPSTHECVGARALGVEAAGCVSQVVYIGACGQSRCSGLTAGRCQDTVGCVLRGGVCEIGD
jgi:hypothetical protein